MEGRDGTEGFCLLFCFLDFFGRSSGGRYSYSSESEGREGGVERGEEGGEIGEKRIQGWRGKRERRKGEEGRDGNEGVVIVEEKRIERREMGVEIEGKRKNYNK